MRRNSKVNVAKEAVKAVAYLRTSSAVNVGGDSDVRQRVAITAYAKAAGIEVVREVYDAAVSGTDPVETRPGFAAMLSFIEAEGVRLVLVEDSSRFARSLVAQELGLALLQGRGVRVVTAGGDDLTNSTDPARVMMRQIGGAFAEYERVRLVEKLRGARDRASTARGKRVEGRKGHADRNPAVVAEARRLARKNPRTGKVRSMREIATELAALGFLTSKGTTFNAGQVHRLLAATAKE
jgi:DNA invertase Pin-like site-specific DNA recombinase